MDITEVRIFKKSDHDKKLRAFATVTFDDCFVVRDVKVIEGSKGLFVAMPSKKKRDNTFRDIAHPLNQETRAMLEKAIFDAYKKEVETMNDSISDLVDK